jgi:hypothetical protein
MAEPSGAEVSPEAKTQQLLARLHRPNVYQRIRDAVQRAQQGESNWIILAEGVGENRRPELLSQVWEFLPTEQRIIAIGDAWVNAEDPEWRLNSDVWLSMFRDVGYHDDDQPAQPPETIALWRGGTLAGMSWSRTRTVAERFQNRRPDSPGRLWTVTVGPGRLLAHYHHDASEDEYVIDPTDLHPTEIRCGCA